MELLMPRIDDRTVYCNDQAARCASAASAARSPEFRDAYLNIEQAWLQLAPGLNGDQPTSAKPKPIGKKRRRGKLIYT
jgi:hypothetical protein